MNKLKTYILSFLLSVPLTGAFAQSGNKERPPESEQNGQMYLQEDKDIEYDEDEVEAGRKNAESELTKRYPDARNIQWDFRHDEHIATFRSEGDKREAHFSQDGTWQRTEQTLNEKDVPEAVKESVEDFEPDAKIQGYRAFESSEGTIYEVVAEQGDQNITLYFDEQGNPVQPPQGSQQPSDPEMEYDLEEEEKTEKEWFDEGEIIFRKT